MVGDAAADGELLGAPSAAEDDALLDADEGAALADDEAVVDVPEPHAARTPTVAMPRQTTTAALRAPMRIRASRRVLMCTVNPPFVGPRGIIQTNVRAVVERQPRS